MVPCKERHANNSYRSDYAQLNEQSTNCALWQKCTESRTSALRGKRFAIHASFATCIRKFSNLVLYMKKKNQCTSFKSQCLCGFLLHHRHIFLKFHQRLWEKLCSQPISQHHTHKFNARFEAVWCNKKTTIISVASSEFGIIHNKLPMRRFFLQILWAQQQKA